MRWGGGVGDASVGANTANGAAAPAEIVANACVTKTAIRAQQRHCGQLSGHGSLVEPAIASVQSSPPISISTSLV